MSTKASFKRDVANHQLRIRLDEPGYKHLVCAVPGSSVFRFEIATFPNYLCFAGGMGEFVFSRESDMLNFFKTSAHNGAPNYDYWAEKCCGVDRSSGIKEFHLKAFISVINDLCEELEGEEERAFVKKELKCYPPISNGNEAFRWASELIYNGETVFPDFWECDFEVYTHRFKWCCHSILWAIDQYDAVKADQEIP